ncbi:MAG: hypothetical protein WCQ47_02005 [bacterium]
MNIIISLLLVLISFTDVVAQTNTTQSVEKKADIIMTPAPSAKQDGALTDNPSTKKDTPAEATSINKNFTFYIAPYIGIGGFYTNSVELDNYPFLSGELRVGFKAGDKLMMIFSADTGFNIKGRTYPVVSTFSIGPECFLTDDFSIFAGMGVGIVTANTNIISAIVTETNAGFDWKAGVTWQAIKWGDKGQYAIPISVTYTGVKTRWTLSNIVLFSMGFMYFN